MIYSYQKSTYETLQRSMRAHALTSKLDLAIRPRNHRLLVGPTGTGKTHLALASAEELGRQTYLINVAGWVVLGAREKSTWSTLLEWAATTPKDAQVVLVLDELDKVHGEDAWTRYLRAELFSLLDGRIPQGVTVDMGEEGEDDLEHARKVITQAMVIGCGAFQGVFEERPPVGFHPHEKSHLKASKLSKSLQTELVNRFNQDILQLPQLTKADYREMLETTLSLVPKEAVKLVKSLGEKRLDLAVEDGASARFAESLVADAFLELAGGDWLDPFNPEKPLQSL